MESSLQQQQQQQQQQLLTLLLQATNVPPVAPPNHAFLSNHALPLGGSPVNVSIAAVQDLLVNLLVSQMQQQQHVPAPILRSPQVPLILPNLPVQTQFVPNLPLPRPAMPLIARQAPARSSKPSHSNKEKKVANKEGQQEPEVVLGKLGSSHPDNTVPYMDVLQIPGMKSFLREKNFTSSRAGVSNPFPYKVHDMLNDNRSDIISWSPHGRSFVILDRERLVQEVLPYHCNQNHWSSFRRQLNIYGFRRCTRPGPNCGVYYHELFLRGHRNLCHFMLRVGVDPKVPIRRGSSSGRSEPDFTSMSLVAPLVAGGKD